MPGVGAEIQRGPGSSILGKCANFWHHPVFCWTVFVPDRSCMLLFFQVYGWEPIPYDNDTNPAPPEVADKIVPGFLPITCEGEVSTNLNWHFKKKCCPSLINLIKSSIMSCRMPNTGPKYWKLRIIFRIFLLFPSTNPSVPSFGI